MQKVKDKEVALCNVKVSGMSLPFRTFGQAKYKRMRFLFAGVRLTYLPDANGTSDRASQTKLKWILGRH